MKRLQSFRAMKLNPPKLDDQQDVAWLAGLLEGEGCFHEGHTGRTLTPQVEVAMADKDIIERVAQFFGGTSVTPKYRQKMNPNWRTQYRTLATSKRAVIIMQAILPYMGKRRSAKIRSILALYPSA